MRTLNRRFRLALVALCLGAFAVPAHALALGERVKSTANVNVRASAAGALVTGCSPNPQPSGAAGAIIDGPTSAALSGTTFTWWRVNFDSGCDGWVAGDNLTSIPVVGSISPSTMTASGSSQSLTVNGSGFQAGNIVQFQWGVGAGSGVWNTGNTPTISSSTRLTVAMNPGTVTDSIQVRVCRSSAATSASDCSSGSHAIAVTAAVASPSVTSISPTSMAADGVSHVMTINGSGFQSGNVIQFKWGAGSGSGTWNTGNAASSLTATLITVNMNPGTVNDTINVRVCRSAAATATSDCSSGVHAVVVTAAVVIPVPSVASISPASMSVSTGARSLTISGSGFQSGNQVQFKWGVGPGAGVWNNASLSFTVGSATQITGSMVPGNVADTIYVRVCRSASQVSNADCSSGTHAVTVTATTLPAAPVVNAISPTSMAASGTAQALTISGANFAAGNQVQFKWGAGTGANVWTAASQPFTVSATVLTGSMNPGTVADTINVRVCRSATQTSTADCSSGLHGVTVIKSATTMTAPTPQAPSGSTSSLTPTFAWSGGSGAASYQIAIRNVATNALYLSPQLATSSSSWPVPAGVLAPNTAYRWDISACPASPANCTSGYVTSANLGFSTGTAWVITGPELTSPKGDIALLTPVLRWGEGSGAAAYEVSIRRITQATPFFTRVTDAATRQITLSPGDLMPGERYEWSVVSCAPASSPCGAGKVGGASMEFYVVREQPQVVPPPPSQNASSGNHWIVVTHGWASHAGLFEGAVGWPDRLVTQICARLGATTSGPRNSEKENRRLGSTLWADRGVPKWATTQCSAGNWRVVTYDWSRSACDPLMEDDCTSPYAAKINAGARGIPLAHELAASSPAFVHFIAHSAGSNMIRNATQVLKALNGDGVQIVNTYLDAFCGAESLACEYGKDADWAEQYVDGTAFAIEAAWFLATHGASLLASTDVTLKYAHNVDVAPLFQRIGFVERHAWPYWFYFMTSCDSGALNGTQYTPGNPPTTPGTSCVSPSAPTPFGGWTYGYPLSAAATSEVASWTPKAFVDALKLRYPIDTRCQLFSSSSGCTSLLGHAWQVTTNAVSGVLRDFNRSRLPCEAGTSVPVGSVFAGSTPAVIGVCSALPGTSSGKDAVATGIEPAVLTTDFTLSEPANMMQFDYEFTGAGAGTLSLLVDDTRVFLAPRLAGVSGVQSSLSIELPTLLAGVHTVAVLVEASGADPLQVAISNLRFMLASDASAGVDVVPDAFAFTAWNDVRAGALVVSDVATISGINAPSPVTVSGGEYSIGCNGVFTAATGEIRAYQTICVRHTAGSANGSTATTTLTIGGVSAAFTSTTLEPVRLGNISTRAQVLGGNDVLIGGFVIAGGASKTVVVRARGPSLVPFGIANALANPVLQLVRSSDQATIAVNDDFGTAGNLAQLQASGFAPTNPLEAAILVDLAPGAYTAIVSGAAGGTGVGIVEVFEVERPDLPLVNISTRGRVLTGDDVMIGGFVIQGTDPQTVVVRARGPSLVPFGIADALANPQLQLVRSSDQATVAFNDDWPGAPNASAIAASGFAPASASEAAILITLPPGAYTAIVTGAGGGTGVGIIEVFAVQ